MHVRPAVYDDIPWMLEQVAAFNEFVGTRHTMFPDAAKAEEKLKRFIDEQPVFIADDNGPLAGMLVALIHHNLWNEDIVVLTEMLWWVPPHYRGSRAAALLLLAFEDCAVSVGADWAVMSLEAKSPMNPDALEKRGYRLQERSYLMERTPARKRQ